MGPEAYTLSGIHTVARISHACICVHCSRFSQVSVRRGIDLFDRPLKADASIASRAGSGCAGETWFLSHRGDVSILGERRHPGHRALTPRNTSFKCCAFTLLVQFYFPLEEKSDTFLPLIKIYHVEQTGFPALCPSQARLLGVPV